jgi:hypothetical protein
LPMLVWQNRCTSRLPITSRASPATTGKWREEILSQHVTSRLPRNSIFECVYCRSN